jgi:glycerol-3-phosphate dehydrogenase
VEGTGCYGAALARFLAANAQVVVEVNRTMTVMATKMPFIGRS